MKSRSSEERVGGGGINAAVVLPNEGREGTSGGNGICEEKQGGGGMGGSLYILSVVAESCPCPRPSQKLADGGGRIPSEGQVAADWSLVLVFDAADFLLLSGFFFVVLSLRLLFSAVFFASGSVSVTWS